jgi:hypothetical protein
VIRQVELSGYPTSSHLVSLPNQDELGDGNNEFGLRSNFFTCRIT